MFLSHLSPPVAISDSVSVSHKDGHLKLNVVVMTKRLTHAENVNGPGCRVCTDPGLTCASMTQETHPDVEQHTNKSKIIVKLFPFLNLKKTPKLQDYSIFLSKLVSI